MIWRRSNGVDDRDNGNWHDHDPHLNLACVLLLSLFSLIVALYEDMHVVAFSVLLRNSLFIVVGHRAWRDNLLSLFVLRFLRLFFSSWSECLLSFFSCYVLSTIAEKCVYRCWAPGTGKRGKRSVNQPESWDKQEFEQEINQETRKEAGKEIDSEEERRKVWDRQWDGGRNA